MSNPWWWREAICPEIGSELFFLADGEGSATARKACQMCPVRVNCLADSIEAGVEHGIFGGFGRDTRRRLAAQVEAGGDPIAVAYVAIQEERKTRERSADHQRAAAGGRRRDRLHALAEGPEEERAHVEPLAPDPARQ